MIENLDKMGRLGPKTPGGPDLTNTDFQKAADKSAKDLKASDAKM